MLAVSITILTVLLVIVCLLMILIVLMQRPKQEGLGAAFGGGMMNDIAGAHTTDILQKGTVWLSVMFFVVSILLGILYTKQISEKNNMKVLDGVKQEQLPLSPSPEPTLTDFSPATTSETPTTTDETPVPTPAPATSDDGDDAGENTPEPGAEEGSENSGDEKPETPETDAGDAPEEGEKKPAESGNPQ